MLMLGMMACRGKHHRDIVKNEEPAEVTPRVASTLKMSDAAAPTQLIRGFYGLEGGTWRWTAGKFAVLLHSPTGAAQRGGTLTFSFSIPDVVIQKLKQVTLTAAIGSTTLKSQTWSKPGAFSYTADVPPELLTKDPVTIDFALDKSLPPGSVDQRELGIIAISAGIEAK